MNRPFDPNDDHASPSDQTIPDGTAAPRSQHASQHASQHTAHNSTIAANSGLAESRDYIDAEYVEEGYADHAEAPLPDATPHHSVRDTLTRIPDALGALGRTLERAIHAKDDYVVAVKVSAEAQAQLEKLVQAGVFRSRAEAAAYLIDEGIIAQAALFARVDQKLSEIERLRSELRGMVSSNPNEGT